MASYQDKIRTKLQSKVFSKIGKSVTFKSKNTPLYNDRGEEESNSYTESTITVVPYNIINERQTYQAFGSMQEGEMDMAVPYTVVVGAGDRFIIENVQWEVKQVAVNYLPDNVVSIIRIVKLPTNEITSYLYTSAIELFRTVDNALVSVQA